MQAQVLTQTVIHDDSVVQGVADNGEDGSEDVQIDVNAHDRENTHGNNDVMDEAGDGAQGEVEPHQEADEKRHGQGEADQSTGADDSSEEVRADGAQDIGAAPEAGGHDGAGHPALLEAAGDIHSDGQNGVEERAQAFFREILADLWTDNLEAFDGRFVVGEGFGQGILNLRTQFNGVLGAGGEAEKIISAVLAVTLNGEARQIVLVKSLLQCLVRDSLLELHLGNDAAGEVDAEIQAAAEKHAQEGKQDERAGKAEAQLALAHEIYIDVVFYKMQ